MIGSHPDDEVVGDLQTGLNELVEAVAEWFVPLGNGLVSGCQNYSGPV